MLSRNHKMYILILPSITKIIVSQMGLCWWPSHKEYKIHKILLIDSLMLQNIHHYFSCVINLLPKYNIIFSEGQTKCTISCIYLYILSIEEFGLSGTGGLPTTLSYTTRSPYCWSHILISLYLYIWISVFRTLFAYRFVTLD